jgi:imidazolonepropionase-like amidohydrolase
MSGKIICGTLLVCLLVILSSGCIPNNTQTTAGGQRIALVGGTLIDGRGGEPIADAVLLIKGDLVEKVGSAGEVDIPNDALVLDLSGSTILPGFINAHVHGGFSEENLKAWVAGGVTTVRDETAPGDKELAELIAWRDSIASQPEYARLISAGLMITVPDGYGYLYVASPEEARQAVLDEIDAGVDQIKVSLEDGYAGESGLPKLTPEELSIIVETAHERGLRVSAHITEAAYIPAMLDAGVDDIAHCAYDPISAAVISRMVDQDIILIPTFTVLRNYGAPLYGCTANLSAFMRAGGRVALGNDYGGGQGDFEMGIPMFEIEMMTSARMTPMEIILAGTNNAAIAVGREEQIGTLEAGKIADILVVNGDPLADLQKLTDIRLVIHNGTIIRQEAASIQ